MEIERKFIINNPPDDLESYPHHYISQGYISTEPVVRIRKRDEEYILTIKSKGLMARTEIEKPLTKIEFEELIPMVKGNLIEKVRYLIPEKNGLTIEMDVFKGIFEGLIMAEVEFPDMETAEGYIPPAYFSEDVTNNPEYQNSALSQKSII